MEIFYFFHSGKETAKFVYLGNQVAIVTRIIYNNAFLSPYWAFNVSKNEHPEIWKLLKVKSKW